MLLEPGRQCFSFLTFKTSARAACSGKSVYTGVYYSLLAASPYTRGRRHSEEIRGGGSRGGDIITLEKAAEADTADEGIGEFHKVRHRDSVKQWLLLIIFWIEVNDNMSTCLINDSSSFKRRVLSKKINDQINEDDEPEEYPAMLAHVKVISLKFVSTPTFNMVCISWPYIQNPRGGYLAKYQELSEDHLTTNGTSTQVFGWEPVSVGPSAHYSPYGKIIKTRNHLSKFKEHLQPPSFTLQILPARYKQGRY
jgi:hypothetical protein